MEVRRRPREELIKRFENNEAKSFVPPVESAERLVEQTAQELKEKYPKRFELYVKWLREKDRMSEEDRSEMKRWLHAMNALDEYAFFSREDENATLRERQKDVFDSIREHVEAGKRTGYVQLPTGVGKTVLFIELAEAINGKTLVVTSRRNLVDQTVDQFSKFAEGLDVGVRYTAHKDVGKQVTVTTYDSLMLGLKDGSLDPAVFDLVILDEAHRGLSEQRQEAIKTFDTSFVFGFSATPTFNESKSLDRLLEEPIYEMKVREAVESGLLSGVSVMVAKTEVDLSSVDLDTTGQYQQRALEEALNTHTLTQSAVELYRKMFDGQQAIVFCVGVQHAKAVAKAFSEAGVSTAAVWGAMPDHERDRILEVYQQGEIKVLTNVDVLTEGFDAPEASVCFNLTPTGSLVRAEQRAGRVLRSDPNRKNKVATVVEFLHNDQRSGSSPVLFSEILDDAVVVPRGGVKKPSTASVEQNEISVDIVVEGLKVITDTKEIMRITREGSEQHVKTERPLWNVFVSQVRDEARKSGVVGGKNWYRKVQKTHSGWPSHPEGTYASDWKTWPELFGRETKKLSWDDFVYSVRETAKIQHVDGSYGWYMKERKKQKGWPPQPEYYYDLWKSWPDLFGREVVEKLPWDTFVLSVRSVAEKEGIVGTVGWYKELQKEHPDWPSNPNASYKDQWSSWPELFGRKKKN